MSSEPTPSSRRRRYASAEAAAGRRVLSCNLDIPPADVDLDLETEAEPSTVDSFSRYHGVHGEFLPFGYRNRNPMVTMRECRSILSEFPATKRTFRTSEIASELGVDSQAVTGIVRPEMFHAIGTWKVEDRTGNRVARWANPHYIHEQTHPHIRTAADRKQWLNELTKLGTIDIEHAANSLGITSGSLQHWCSTNGYEWRKRRARGKYLIARSWATAVAWDTSYPTIAEAFGVPVGTVKSWVHKYATRQGFTPPRDPTGSDTFVR